jgi:hypothetical protein
MEMADIAIHWSGVLLVAGAALLGAGIIWTALKPVVNQALSPQVSRLFLIAAILLLLSLPGMYARQANASGWLGLAGYGLLQAGMVLLILLSATPLLYPSFNQTSGENIYVFALGIALTLGLLLTGLATARSGVYPQWAGILLLAATAGFFFVFFIAEFLPPGAGQLGSAIFGALLALGLVWIGLSVVIG